MADDGAAPAANPPQRDPSQRNTSHVEKMNAWNKMWSARLEKGFARSSINNAIAERISCGHRSFGAIYLKGDDCVKEYISNMHPAEFEMAYSLIDFSFCSMASQGLHCVLSVASSLASGSLQIVKVHHNCLGNEGARLLAPLLKEPTIREVHASHNNIEANGAKAMMAALRHGLPDRKELIMVRLEHNRICDPLNLVEEFLEPSVYCQQAKKSCTRQHCVDGKRIHLPFIWEQNDGDADRSSELQRARSRTPRRRKQELSSTAAKALRQLVTDGRIIDNRGRVAQSQNAATSAFNTLGRGRPR